MRPYYKCVYERGDYEYDLSNLETIVSWNDKSIKYITTNDATYTNASGWAESWQCIDPENS